MLDTNEQDHLQKWIQVQEAITQLICTVMMATNYYAIGGHSSEPKAVGMVFSIDTKVSVLGNIQGKVNVIRMLDHHYLLWVSLNHFPLKNCS